MSDSDLSDAPSAPAPPDSELEATLRDQVRDAFTSGKGDSITVSLIRKATEAELGLEAGFFKRHSTWKERSKAVVEESYEKFQNGAGTPEKPKPKPNPVKIAVGKKRASADGENDIGAAKKRRKSHATVDSNDSLSSAPSDVEVEKPPRKTPAKSKKPTKSVKSDDNIISDDEPNDKGKASTAHDPEASDSDLSSLIEAHIPPKKRKSSGASVKSKSKPTLSRSASTKSKSDANLDPDAAEIKRLQGWLVKCGIRKLWGKELKPYESPKEKINHLKAMLADAGMTGRYSAEKASQIREERELKADIEAVTEGDQRWGKTGDEDDGEGEGEGGAKNGGEDGRTKPKRLVRGAHVLDFLDSDDGEETD